VIGALEGRSRKRDRAERLNRNAVTEKAAQEDPTRIIWSTSSTSVPVALPAGRWLGSRKQLPVVPTLITSDVLLALAMWWAASVLEGVLGYGQPSGIAVASMVPNVVAWVGVRALLGLYPGYVLDQVEELRRQTFASLTTLAIIAVSAFASEIDELLSRILLWYGVS
jgi:hypothetical protein